MIHGTNTTHKGKFIFLVNSFFFNGMVIFVHKVIRSTPVVNKFIEANKYAMRSMMVDKQEGILLIQRPRN